MTAPIPAVWMPEARVERVILHWTAGGYLPSSVDCEHYHFVIDGAGGVHRGDHAVDANDSTGDGDYAAHVRGLNTGSVGIAVCAMAGAERAGLRFGPYPVLPLQWERLAACAALLCARYEVPIGPRTVLSHGDVERVLGVPQAGKWDVCVLPWKPDLSPVEVALDFRRRVLAHR